MSTPADEIARARAKERRRLRHEAKRQIQDLERRIHATPKTKPQRRNSVTQFFREMFDNEAARESALEKQQRRRRGSRSALPVIDSADFVDIRDMQKMDKENVQELRREVERRTPARPESPPVTLQGIMGEPANYIKYNKAKFLQLVRERGFNPKDDKVDNYWEKVIMLKSNAENPPRRQSQVGSRVIDIRDGNGNVRSPNFELLQELKARRVDKAMSDLRPRYAKDKDGVSIKKCSQLQKWFSSKCDANGFVLLSEDERQRERLHRQVLAADDGLPRVFMAKKEREEEMDKVTGGRRTRPIEFRERGARIAREQLEAEEEAQRNAAVVAEQKAARDKKIKENKANYPGIPDTLAHLDVKKEDDETQPAGTAKCVRKFSNRGDEYVLCKVGPPAAQAGLFANMWSGFGLFDG